MWVAFKRIVRSGAINFWRSAFVSLAAIFVMTVALFMIASTMLDNYSLRQALEDLQEKVDINVYFVTTASEGEIASLKTALESLPEVAEVAYTSRDQALQEFRDRHSGDALTIQALDELGENPLGASLSIRAHQTSHYEGVAAFLADRQALEDPQSPVIDRVNYARNQVAIDRLGDIIDDTQTTNTIRTSILLLLAIFVSFVTIRLAIHHSREEIGVMRLVGASNAFIRGPFVVTGIMQGLFAGVLVLILLYPALIFYESAFYPFPFFEEVSGGMLLGYYVHNFPYFLLVLVGGGIIIGAVSSALAVSRYLRV
jgi:cell division transport system permease protein